VPSSSDPKRILSGIRARPGRVLVIDDEPLVADAIALILSDENNVVVATNPEDALGRLERGERYDVVLCDLMMPGINGMELHDRLSETLPAEAARLVFITGGIFLAHVRAFLDRVPNLCLEKPLDLEAMRALIARRMRDSLDDSVTARSGS
jgi:CheY-like chemotaxis protein